MSRYRPAHMRLHDWKAMNVGGLTMTLVWEALVLLRSNPVGRAFLQAGSVPSRRAAVAPSLDYRFSGDEACLAAAGVTRSGDDQSRSNDSTLNHADPATLPKRL